MLIKLVNNGTIQILNNCKMKSMTRLLLANSISLNNKIFSDDELIKKP